MASIETQITSLRKRFRDAEVKEAQIGAKIEAEQERLTEANDKCKEHGITPEQLDETITKLEKQMTTLAKSVVELLPDGEDDVFI